jgi:uncharacterized protein
MMQSPRSFKLRKQSTISRLGVISDTHGLLRPEAKRSLAGVDHIIHAGDIGGQDIVSALARIAPVTAIRGNVDNAAWAQAYPETQSVSFAGRSIFVLHDLKAMASLPAGCDIVISGHSHVPKVEIVNDVLYLNPGSAGRRRFGLPITLALLEFDQHGIRSRIIDLAS